MPLHLCYRGMHLFGRRDEFFGQLRSRAKEILLHLLDKELLRFRLPRLQAIFIEQHLGVLGPHAPRLGAYVFINLLSQFSIERGFVQAGKFASKLCAFDHTRHGNIVTRGEGELGLLFRFVPLASVLIAEQEFPEQETNEKHHHGSHKDEEAD